MENDEKSRIKREVVNINTLRMSELFERRAKKLNDHGDHYPLEVSEFNADNLRVNALKNEEEWKLIRPLLALTGRENVLDLASGTGRVFDALHDEIKFGLGIDGSPSLVKLAKKLVPYRNCHFITGNLLSLGDILLKEGEKFDRIIMCGVLIYINDKDLPPIFEAMRDFLRSHGIIYLRETLANTERLTLKDFPSKELARDYSAIYRTPSEMNDLLSVIFPPSDYEISNFQKLWDDKGLYRFAETHPRYCLIRKKV